MSASTLGASARLIAFVIAALMTAAPLAAKEEISDDLLYDRVNRKIVNDYQLKTNALKIEVLEGVVTVDGYVKTEKLRLRVTKVVKKVKGVKKVVNNVEVRR